MTMPFSLIFSHFELNYNVIVFNKEDGRGLVGAPWIAVTFSHRERHSHTHAEREREREREIQNRQGGGERVRG